MATASNKTLGGSTDGVSYNQNAPKNCFSVTVDIAKAIGSGTGQLSSFASGDSIAVAGIAHPSRVILRDAVNVTALTVGTTPAINIGLATDTDALVQSSAAVAAGSLHTAVSGANDVGVRTTADTNLVVQISNGTGAITEGQINLVYEVIDLSPLSVGGSF